MEIKKDTELKKILEIAPPCSCRQCRHGCTMGSGILEGDDAKNIARLLKITEEELKEKFLEEIEQFNQKKFRPKILRKEKSRSGAPGNLSPSQK